MNFGYKKTIEKRKHLKSVSAKLSTKLIISGFKTFLYVFLLLIVIAGLAVFGMIKGILDNAPSVEEVNIMPSGYSTVILDNKGKQIETLVTSGSNRTFISINELPQYLLYAFVDIEDERFYQHNGIDLKGILRAASVALTTGHFSEGASTITQQLIKNNVFPEFNAESSLAESFKRKIQEQYLALELEKINSKEEILENYLNTINLGSNTLGIQSAAKRYFNKDAKDLTLSESVVIAAITQNPSYNSPILHPENNSKRREKILNNMKDNKHITVEEYNEALQDDVYSRIQQINTNIGSNESPYSYFTDALIEQVIDDLQTLKGYTSTQAYNALYSGGLTIYSTQDRSIQKICDEEISNDENYPQSITYSISWAYSIKRKDGTIENFSEADINYYHKVLLEDPSFQLIFNTKEEAKACVREYKKAYKKKGDTVLGEHLIYTPQPQASFTVMDQSNGYVKAIVGGRGKKQLSLSLNRATISKRQPGSCFKILSAYSPALDSGNYSLATTIQDSPFYYENGRAVKNWWGESYKGYQTLRAGITQSMNVVTVKLLNELTPQVGVDSIINYGITTLTEDDNTLPIALGGITNGVTNLELCAAYASIANGGYYNKPTLYSKVLDHNGRVLLEASSDYGHTVIKDSTAYLLTSAMHDVVTKSSGTGKQCNLEDYYVAGKTGTTTNNYDIWFAGYTPYLTATIWSGYDENRNLGTTTYHNVLWQKIMQRIHEKKKYESKTEWEVPDSVVYASVNGKTEYYAKDTLEEGSYTIKNKVTSNDDWNDWNSWENEDPEATSEDNSETEKKTKKDKNSNKSTKKRDKPKKDKQEATTAPEANDEPANAGVNENPDATEPATDSTDSGMATEPEQ